MAFKLLKKGTALPEQGTSSPPVLPFNKPLDYVVGFYFVLSVDVRRRVNTLFRDFHEVRGMWWLNYWSFNFAQHYGRYLMTIRRRRWEYGDSDKWKQVAENR